MVEEPATSSEKSAAGAEEPSGPQESASELASLQRGPTVVLAITLAILIALGAMILQIAATMPG